jgi:hypothetical protein
LKKERSIWEEDRDYEIKSKIEFEISKTQNMTLRGDVPVKYLLQKDTMMKYMWSHEEGGD